MSKTKTNSGIVVVISGPSGVGKGTICRELVKRIDNAYLSMSVTTRPKSDKEVDGKDYWFVSKEEFQKRIDNGTMLEYAEVFGNFYGTPKDKLDEALAAGKAAILEIDVQGGKQVKEVYPGAVMIFILAPTQKERLNQAQTEIAAAWQYYEHMVINDKLQDAVGEIIAILDSARMGKKDGCQKE
jgi:guanylate kinase